MKVKLILFSLFILFFCIFLLGVSETDERCYFLPDGWPLPDKNHFTFKNERIIDLGDGSIKKIIEREYKFSGSGEGYPFYIPRFDNNNCIWLDEFYRFFLGFYWVYLVKSNGKEYVLFYVFVNSSVAKVYECGEYSITEPGYGYTVLLSNFSMNGVFDRLHIISGIEPHDLADEDPENRFPYKTLLKKLLSSYDISALGKK